MDSTSQVQILDKAVSISLGAFKKSKNKAEILLILFTNVLFTVLTPLF